MIARSALPFSARNLLDRILQSVSGPRQQQHYARHLFSGAEPPLPSTWRRTGGNGSGRWQRIFAAYGDWSSALDLASRGEARSSDRTEQLRRYCRDCEQDTSHEEFDEFGLGWYALICRCRRCGREGMSVWPLASW
jgi:hypothetical protein